MGAYVCARLLGRDDIGALAPGKAADLVAFVVEVLGGTEVAKEAAAMVLTDDNFASIEAAVEEGRGVWDNLVKFITWTLPTNFGEGLVIVAAILFGATLPITPLQILWINMTTAVLLGLPLALSVVNEVLAEAPEVVSVLAVVAVVALTTRLGLLAASAAARRLAR